MGIHIAEFEVTFSDKRIRTFPKHGYLKINVTQEIDNGRATEAEENLAIKVSKIEEFKTLMSDEYDAFKSGAAQILNEAQEVINNANTQAEKAEQSAINANNKAGLAEEKAILASEKANLADEKAQLAQTH
ncbi:hypothetical protein [Halalkalibacter flavus]|uniref:hypothetical protein n=1 Tax=Halalkalibacter flavus TaxID=3090668 RepID=UPI002FC7DAF1